MSAPSEISAMCIRKNDPACITHVKPYVTFEGLDTSHCWTSISAVGIRLHVQKQRSRVGQNHIYTVCIRYFWQGTHHIYGHIRCIYTFLANPTKEAVHDELEQQAICSDKKVCSMPGPLLFREPERMSYYYHYSENLLSLFREPPITIQRTCYHYSENLLSLFREPPITNQRVSYCYPENLLSLFREPPISLFREPESKS